MCLPCRRNEMRETPLHIASRSDKLDIVKYLIEECHVNPEEKDNEGDTPFDITFNEDTKEYYIARMQSKFSSDISDN